MGNNTNLLKALQSEFAANEDEIVQGGQMVIAANVMYMQYQAFVKAGFTEKQALELMKTVIAANAGNVKGEN